MRFEKLKDKLHQHQKEYTEKLDSLIKEHKRLVKVLKHPTKSSLNKEASIQGKELKHYEEV